MRRFLLLSLVAASFFYLSDANLPAQDKSPGEPSGRKAAEGASEASKPPAAPSRKDLVFRLDGAELVRAESPKSPLAQPGVQPDDEVTFIVRLKHVAQVDAIATLQNILSEPGVRKTGLGGGLRVGEVSGAPMVIFRGKAVLVDYALRVLELLDAPVDLPAVVPQPERVVEMIDVEHAAAHDLAAIIESFLVRPAVAGIRAATRGPTVPTTATPGLPRGRTTIIADQRSNKLIVATHSRRDLEDIRTLVRELDQPIPGAPPPAQPKTLVYRMRFLDAEETADVLQTILGSGGPARTRSPMVRRVMAGPQSSVTVVPHPEANSLLIRGTPEEVAEITDVLSKIDVEGESAGRKRTTVEDGDRGRSRSPALRRRSSLTPSRRPTDEEIRRLESKFRPIRSRAEPETEPEAEPPPSPRDPEG